MGLRLADRWIWDSWHADDGERFHLFYLQAPRTPGDQQSRHWNTTVGHAVSTDLRHWQVVDDALGPGPAGAWDDLAIWTGSVVRDGDRWVMLYTGCSTREGGLVQRIGAAVSTDLYHWDKLASNPVLEADARWYERLDRTRWHDEAWRDPWIFAAPDGDGFHALVTARVPDAPTDTAGVIGHAWSPDLHRWEVRPPLSGPSGFGQLEVPQVVSTERGYVLLFSFDPHGLPYVGAGAGRPASTYAAPAGGPLGPFVFDQAVPVGEPGTFAGRVINDRAGRPHLVAFVNHGPDGFVGEIADPLPLEAIWPQHEPWQ